MSRHHELAIVDYRAAHDYVDLVIKGVVLGNEGVGKTTLLHNLTTPNIKEEQRSPTTSSTVGFEMKSLVTTLYTILPHELEKRHCKVKIQFWDTSGASQFDSLSIAYIRECAFIWVCYDVHQPQTQSNLQRYMQLINEHCTNPDVFILFIQTKMDQPRIHHTEQQIQEWLKHQSFDLYRNPQYKFQIRQLSSWQGEGLQSVQMITENHVAQVITNHSDEIFNDFSHGIRYQNPDSQYHIQAQQSWDTEKCCVLI